MVKFEHYGIVVPATSTEVEAAKVAFDALATGARRLGASFTKPDDDWFPLFLVLTQSQGTFIYGRMPNTRAKEAMVSQTANFARKVGAVAIGHLHSTWSIHASDVASVERRDAIIRQMRAQNGSSEGIPERRERLTIIVHTATGTTLYDADINRHEGPPTLGEFVSQKAGTAGGRMVDPLQRALKRIG